MTRALLANAGAIAAAYNVRINLPHTKDEAFITEMEATLGGLLDESKSRCEAIQQQVENPLAQAILNGEFAPGDTIEVAVDDDRLEFQNAA